ncbi:MAG: FecR family protein [Phocaeicola sp.]
MDESILINYLKGEAKEEECDQVEAWSEASDVNRKTLEELYYILFLSDRNNAMNAIDVEESLARFKKNLKQKEQKSKQSFRWKKYMAYVAAFLVGAIFSVGIFQFYSQERDDYYTVFTEAGQRAQVVLPDGTHVWLNASTRLAYKKEFWSNNRFVDLIGEAYFEVERDEYTPFVVHSQDINISVLGTKFNVRSHPVEDRVVTTLFSGSVRIDNPNTPDNSFLLKPGQTLDMNLNTHTAELEEYATPSDVLLWINGKLRFEQATLVNIVATLEKHFDVHFIFDNDQIKSERFTCQFSTDDTIEQILATISLTNRLTYRREAKQVYLMHKK